MSNLDKYTVEELDRENNELRARNITLEKELLYFIDRVEVGSIQSKTTYDRFKECLIATPSQSLADIKADAIAEMINEVPLMGANTLCISEIDEYIDKLRGKS